MKTFKFYIMYLLRLILCFVIRHVLRLVSRHTRELPLLMCGGKCARI